MRKPKFDPGYQPIERRLEAYEEAVKAAERKQRVTLAVERNGGYNYIYSFDAFADGTGKDGENLLFSERILKTVLWLVGGYRVGVGGSEFLYRALRERYCATGERAFDADFMSGVYEKPFEVYFMREGEIPAAKSVSLKAGGHLKGCRIGFDAGGSDRKVSAVIGGKAVYSEEVVWHPKTTSDPSYHYREILTAMRTAASKMPRVDAIGVSSAGVYVDNRIMASSLFISVDKEKYGDYVKNMYLNIAKEMGDIPIEVANDGDVTALAGSLESGEKNVLGIAMGTSEAVGYINADGGLNGWLSELAFVPVDLNGDAMTDEWSGDKGVGCKYFSQDAVIKLARAGGYVFRENSTPAEKLKEIQKLAEEGDSLALQVFDDIGVYLAYTLPFYARFYRIERVLLLGRVTAGRGGAALLAACKRTLKEEFPDWSGEIILPDESSRRVGQSIAAASLPPDRE